MKDKLYRYTVVFEPAEEGGYVVTVPALPGCITEGDTLEAARAMARDAITGYLETLREAADEIPKEAGDAVTETVDIQLAAQ